MSDIMLSIENVSKMYNLGEINTTTYYHDIRRWWAGLHRITGHVDDVHQHNTVSDTIWALKDVSFCVKQGEVIGIMGRNGAGKSTLLKILSRVTAPTLGILKVRGRITSLLEVGTGFHPELSGRENVFLNGSLLGMNRSEVSRKFDEIINFSGVEKFIDTPVKHYSSGMYVRLAFSVAAHLESEVIIVDEVLAVGDTNFKKKCLQKIRDMAVQGRTVLFVSHSLGTLAELCEKSILLEDGKVKSIGETEKIINDYLAKDNQGANADVFFELKQNSKSAVAFLRASITDMVGTVKTEVSVLEEFKIRLEVFIRRPQNEIDIAFRVKNQFGLSVFVSSCADKKIVTEKSLGVHTLTANIPPHFLSPGKYYVTIAAHLPLQEVYDFHEDVLSFEVVEYGSSMSLYKGSDVGAVLVDLPWSIS